jgi:dTDP-4-dehydrorhamnose reductase
VEVAPCTTDEFPRPARRPAWSVLDVARFEAAVGRRVEPWIHGLGAYLESEE